MKAILTFADPMQYQTPLGTTLAGHWGCIYQSLNMRFCGRSSARTKWLSPRDGRPIDGRMLSKIWCEESGQGYSEQALIDAGAPKRHYGETPQDWLRRVKPHFPKIKHPGTLAYGLGLTQEARSLLEKTVVARPYPKSDVLVVARSMAA